MGKIQLRFALLMRGTTTCPSSGDPVFSIDNPFIVRAER